VKISVKDSRCEVDERGVGKVHGPIAIAGHQGVYGIEVIIGDGGHRDGP
jgi:hypothetical protein